MDCFRWIIIRLLKAGTAVRRFFKYIPALNSEHHIKRAVLISQDFQITDITYTLPDNNLLLVGDIKTILEHHAATSFLEVLYNFDQKTYKIFYDISRDILPHDDSHILFPLYSDEDAKKFCPPSNILSAVAHGSFDAQDITLALRHYEGPFSNFHDTHTSSISENLCWKTLLILNGHNHLEYHKIEIMTGQCDFVVVDNMTRKVTQDLDAQ